MTIASEPVRDWLKTRRQLNELHQDLMALRYDLDGAMASAQVGPAWRAQEGLLRTGIHLHLSYAGVPVPARRDEDRMDRVFRLLDALERANRSLAADAWRLWLRPVPPQHLLTREIDRTLTFVGRELGIPWVSSRRETVLRWASDTQALRTVAKEFGIAQSDDWYLSEAAPGEPTGDWYREVLASLDDEERT